MNQVSNQNNLRYNQSTKFNIVPSGLSWNHNLTTNLLNVKLSFWVKHNDDVISWTQCVWQLSWLDKNACLTLYLGRNYNQHSKDNCEREKAP